jgi:hypothetical protein
MYSAEEFNRKFPQKPIQSEDVVAASSNTPKVVARNIVHFNRLEKMLIQTASRIFKGMTDCANGVFTKVVAGLREKVEDKEWLKNVSERGPAVLSNLNMVLFQKNPYVAFIKILIQFYGVHIKLSPELNQTVYLGAVRCINAISLFYEIQSDFSDKLGFGDIDAGQNDPNFEFYQYVPHQALQYNIVKLYQ